MTNLKLFTEEKNIDKGPIAYDIYHDECQEDGFWHCLLFVPVTSKEKLNHLICQARNNLNYNSVIHYSSISKKAKSCHPKIRFVRSLNTIASFAIQQQKFCGDIYLGHKNNESICIKGRNDLQIKAKFAIFRDTGKHRDMYMDMTAKEKFETTFRMALKGANHFLFDKEIIIRKIFHDYGGKIPFEKTINQNNVLKRLIMESRDHIKFDKNIKIHTFAKKALTGNIDDHNFLQLTDVIVGSIRTKLLNHKNFPSRFEAAYPYGELLEKNVEIKPRMQNSRFYRGYTLTNAMIENGDWRFENMKIKTLNDNQFKLLN